MVNKKQANKVIVLCCDKLKPSRLGNPRYSVVLHNLDNNEVMRGITASGHQFAYCMPTTGSVVSVKWHKTKKGNVIFDDMETVSKGIDN